MHSGLGPGRSHSLPLVGGLYHAFDRKGLKDLSLVGGLHLAWQTSTTRASGTAPCQRTLSCTVVFDHKWPQELLLVGGLCLA